MKAKLRIISGLGAIVLALFVGVIVTIYSQADKNLRQNANENTEHFPTVVCCAKNDAENEDRNSKGGLYEKKVKLLWDKDTAGNVITTFSHWDAGLPALPVSKSDLIVRGKVTDANAYLTPNRTDVYSEFSIQVDEILKNGITLATFVGDTIVASRNGGRVRFPSGRTLSYVTVGQDMPQKTSVYIFFIEHKENQYVILTAYEVVGSKIYPLDGENAPVGSTWKGDVYQGADFFEFSTALGQAIENGGRDQ